MPTGDPSRAIDNRSLADDPESTRKMRLSETGGRMGAVRWVYIHSVSGRDISLSGFYLNQLADIIQKCFVPFLLNKSHIETHKHKLYGSMGSFPSWYTLSITQTQTDYQLLTFTLSAVNKHIDSSLSSN